MEKINRAIEQFNMLDFPFMWALLIKANWIKFGLIK